VSDFWITFDSSLDTGAWDASRDEIVPFLHHPELQRRIAFHFSRLESLRRLTMVHLDFISGNKPLNGEVAHDLRAHLLREVRALLDDGKELKTALRDRLQ
jgi:hypothetical protein